MSEKGKGKLVRNARNIPSTAKSPESNIALSGPPPPQLQMLDRIGFGDTPRLIKLSGPKSNLNSGKGDLPNHSRNNDSN